MTKNMTSKSTTITARGDGGTYNSDQQSGFGTLVRMHDVMGRFGAGPNVYIYMKGTGGVDGEIAPLDLNEIGPAWDGSIDNQGEDNQPRYFMAGSTTTGVSGRRGLPLEVDNLRCGFQKLNQVPFTKFRTIFQMYQPSDAGFYFSGTTATNTMPGNSVLKQCWHFDGELSPTTADVVTASWVGDFWQMGGNRHDFSLSSFNQFDFSAWNTFNAYEDAGEPDPYTDLGIMGLDITVPSHGTETRFRDDVVIAGGGSLRHQYTGTYFPGWSGSGPQANTQHLFRYFYHATGDNYRAFIAIGNNATYTSCTSIIPAPPNLWEANLITTTLDDDQLLGATHMHLELADGTKMTGVITAPVNGVIDVVMS